MTPFLIYGAILLAVVVLAHSTARATHCWLALIALTHWGIYSAILIVYGYAHVGLQLVALSWLATLASVGAAYTGYPRLALAQAALWFAGALVAGAFTLAGQLNSYVCYLMLNLTFLARMAALGGPSVAELLSRARHHRPDDHLRGARGARAYGRDTLS